MNFDWGLFKATMLEMHSHLGTWYSYLVAFSVTLQASWSELDTYIPPKARHWVIGIATLIVIVDKALRAAKTTRAEVGPKI